MSLQEPLRPGEEILHRARPTRIVLAPPIAVAVLLVGVGLFVWFWKQNLVVPLFCGAGALIAALAAGWKHVVLESQQFVLTQRRLILQTGLVNRNSADLYLDKIDHVEYRQTLWGRMLDYGDVRIETTGDSEHTLFPNIEDPAAFKRALLEAVDAQRAAGRGFVAAAPAPIPAAERLRQLKRLHDDGLISNAEFEAKRQSLVQEL